jgi:hypothetical protein
MKNNITRRDFLNGTQVAIGASLLSPWTNAFGAYAFQLEDGYYPPALTGMRGRKNLEGRHARGTIRPGCRRCRYQRPGVGLLLSPGKPGRPHPDY